MSMIVWVLRGPACCRRRECWSGRRHELALAGERVFGHDYVRTLRDWRIRFRSAWPSIEQMGFDARFRRLWEYYLAYSEAGFRSGMIDVRQMVFARQR